MSLIWPMWSMIVFSTIASSTPASNCLSTCQETNLRLGWRELRLPVIKLMFFPFRDQFVRLVPMFDCHDKEFGLFKLVAWCTPRVLLHGYSGWTKEYLAPNLVPACLPTSTWTHDIKRVYHIGTRTTSQRSPRI
ncbi:hypothetical protein B0H10DRAFT_2059079 [Mycena sp. CBHHK59/15]|nr:hypothetical protein B0H10DRAFT_2059079 [Mycena sp. CBHHK59/15]